MLKLLRLKSPTSRCIATTEPTITISERDATSGNIANVTGITMHSKRSQPKEASISRKNIELESAFLSRLTEPEEFDAADISLMIACCFEIDERIGAD